MPSMNYLTEQLSPVVRRRVMRLCEPMRTRVEFYLTKAYQRKSDGEKLTETDINVAFGKAYQDKLEDEEAFDGFDSGELDLSHGTTPVRELINAVSR